MAFVRRISRAITLYLDAIVFPLIDSCALTPGINGTWSEKVELDYASPANLSASIFNFASSDSSPFEVVLS
jgi:hypothetical protein